jgi:hypothetical protein
VDETSRDTEKIICIIGNNSIARAFLIENCILSQYGDNKRLKVFIICEGVQAYYNSVLRHYPNLNDFLEVVPVELKNDNFSSKHQWDDGFIKAIPSIDAVYVFGDKDAKLINTSLHLRQFLYEKTMNIRKVPIIVCLPEETRVVNMLNGDEEASGKLSLSDRFKDQIVIHLVRKFTDTCSVKRMIDGANETEVVAKAINYFYSIKYDFDNLLITHFKKSSNTEFLHRLEKEMLQFKVKRVQPLQQIESLILDFIKKYTNSSEEKVRSVFGVDRLWNNLTDRKKESNRYVARHLEVKYYILKKLGVKNFSAEEISSRIKQIAPIEHDRWLAEKYAFDFSYGKLPSTDKNLKKILKDTLKVHDQLVPYNELDTVNKEKDLDMFLLLPLLQKIKDNHKE